LDRSFATADEIPGSRRDGEAELRAAAGPGQAHGLVDELEAQRGERLEDVVEGALEGVGPAGGAGLDLEAADGIQRQGV
jgi:hypothetical protein